MIWVGIALVVIIILALSMRQDSGGRAAILSRGYVPAAEYVRRSDPEMFYELSGTLGPATAEVARFVDAIAARTGLDRGATSFPTDPKVVKSVAEVFSESAKDVFGATLDLRHHNPDYIDVFVNQHLLDPKLRPYFEGPVMKELAEGELEAFEDAMEAAVIPNEPLLFYALGAYWGEWLVQHKNATWVLFDPLRLPQTFPDGLTAAGTMCAMPFSHVAKKLADPEGDQLAFKAEALYRDRRLFGPHPLLASIADATQAALGLLPEKGREAQILFEGGSPEDGMAAFREAIAASPDHPRLLSLGASAALMTGDGELGRSWLEQLAALEPDNLTVIHNLAAVDSQTPEKLPAAIEALGRVVDKDPSYARARITLASCLVEVDRKDEAKAQLEWVKENAPEMTEEAEQMLGELGA